MADGHGEGTNREEGPYDPLLDQENYFDDVMYLFDIPNILDAPPLAIQPPPQNATADGYSGDNNLLEQPATLNSSVHVNNTVPIPTPTHIAQVSPTHIAQMMAADLPSTSRTHDVGASASTSATTASTSAAATQQNALDCTGCHVLREVVHSNGLADEATKLCVHGGPGVFYHATLEVYRVNSEATVTAMTHQSYVDFRGRDLEWVKHYLAEYAHQRAGGGYTVIYDSISSFHDALCAGMNYGGNAAADDRRGGEMAAAAAVGNGGGGGHQQQELAGAAPPIIEQGHAPAAAGPSGTSANNEQQQREVIPPVGRSPLSIQRERASKLQLGDLARCFHLPMAEAATHLGVCPTVLKSTSRKFRIPRWPHRKIKSINSQIAKLREKQGGNGGEVAVREAMDRLIESKKDIYATLLGHQ